MPENRQIAEETCDKYDLKQKLIDNAKVCLVNSDHLQISYSAGKLTFCVF